MRDKIEISVERDSFCMADDCCAPHLEKFEYENYQMISDFINEVAWYLPNPRSKITWDVLKDTEADSKSAGTKIATVIKQGNNTECSLQVPDCMISDFASRKVYCSITRVGN